MLTENEFEIVKWCLLTEAKRCNDFLIAETFDGKTFRVNYQKRHDVVMSALRKVEEQQRAAGQRTNPPNNRVGVDDQSPQSSRD